MEESKRINLNLDKLPIKTTLSFEYLIDDLNKISRTTDHPLCEMAAGFLKKLDQAPELKNPVSSKAVLEKNHALVSQMMSFIFNPLNDDTDISAAFSPFNTNSFYSTTHYNETITAEHRRLEVADKMNNDKMMAAMLYQAYLFIFDKVYNIHISDRLPFTFKLIDEKDNSIKYYKKQFNTKYIKIKPIGKLIELSQEEIKELFDNSDNFDLWFKRIPLEKFEISGFVQFTYIDITHDYVLSQLKSDLLDKNTILSHEGFLRIREKVRTLFDNPNVEFGMAAYNEFESILNKNIIWNTIIPQSELKCDEYLGTLYEKAFFNKRS